MKLPIQAKPIHRQNMTNSYASFNKMYSGLEPSICPNPDNTPPGTCFDANGPIPGRWNCSACCALRGAISWQGGNQAFVC
ncbi:MAG: hypothetical protein ACR9NN_17980 [Nostochopsis sp.]